MKAKCYMSSPPPVREGSALLGPGEFNLYPETRTQPVWLWPLDCRHCGALFFTDLDGRPVADNCASWEDTTLVRGHLTNGVIQIHELLERVPNRDPDAPPPPKTKVIASVRIHLVYKGTLFESWYIDGCIRRYDPGFLVEESRIMLRAVENSKTAKSA